MRFLPLVWIFVVLFSQWCAQAGQLWLYSSQNLWVDKNIDALETLFARAGKAGYTHVLLTDSKFGNQLRTLCIPFASVINPPKGGSAGGSPSVRKPRPKLLHVTKPRSYT